MKKIATIFSLILVIATSSTIYAQSRWGSAISSIYKTTKALTLTDAQMAQYAKESVAYMDKNNKVAPASSAYSQRLKRLTRNLKTADGIPLNFKVYLVKDVNAFACPDGSVRVFSALMDGMSDNELLGVIGHEIGHVAMHHSKNAFRNELLTGAARDALIAGGGKMGALSSSMLGSLGESLITAKYSRKQEREADDYGYDFLKKNGVNPYGMVMAFEKLDKMSGKSKSSYVLKMFSSHPETKERISRMESRAKNDGYKRPAK